MFDEPLINILVVEDDERLASLTRDYLVRHGTAVTIVDNGEDGLREATGTVESDFGNTIVFFE